MNDKKQKKTAKIILFAFLLSTFIVSLTHTGDAWAVDDYYIDQWKVADKKITSLDEEIKNLNGHVEQLEEKIQNTLAENQKDMMRNKITNTQKQIDQKMSQIIFLESEVDRLEKLNIESFKIDGVTESLLMTSLQTIENKYESNESFFSVMIDYQDKALIVFVHPNSDLSAEQFESDIGNVANVSVDEGFHGSISCLSKHETCSNPLYGGVQVKRDNDSGGPGTLSYYATSENGDRGFVIAGHVADFMGALITQPENGRIIGQVTQYCGQNSSCDAAFVHLTNGETGSNRIHKSGSSYYNVIGKTPDSSQTLGTFVKKSGITTDVTYGTISGNLPNKHYNFITFSSNNWIANGDSGSPVFKQPSTRSNNVYLYGMIYQAGGNGHYGLYHPQDYLADMLNLQ